MKQKGRTVPGPFPVFALPLGLLPVTVLASLHLIPGDLLLPGAWAGVLAAMLIQWFLLKRTRVSGDAANTMVEGGDVQASVQQISLNESDLADFRTLAEERARYIQELDRRVHQFTSLLEITNRTNSYIQSRHIAYDEILTTLAGSLTHPELAALQIQTGDTLYQTPNWKDPDLLDKPPLEVTTGEGITLRVRYVSHPYYELEHPEIYENPFTDDEIRYLELCLSTISTIHALSSHIEKLDFSQEILNQLPLAIFSLDLQGNIGNYFGKFNNHPGFDPAKAGIPDTVPQIFIADTPVSWKEIVDEVLTNLEFETQVDLHIENNGIVPVWLSASLHRDSSGTVKKIIVMIRDILEEKELEKKQLQSEAKYRSIFSESKDMIFYADTDYRIIEINDAGLALLGVPDRRSCIGTKISDYFLIEEDFTYLLGKVREKIDVHDTEAYIKAPGGAFNVCLVSLSARIAAVSPDYSLQGIIKNINDRIMQEQLLWKTNLELTQANEEINKTHRQLLQQEKLASIGQLAAGVAHEINNPLGFVKSNISSLKGYITQMTSFIHDIEYRTKNSGLLERLEDQYELREILPDLDALFSETEDGISRMMLIIQNLKSFSRTGTGENFTRTNINEIISNTLVLSKNAWKYIAEIKSEAGDIPEIPCRRNEISQVILNLIMNSVQAIESQKRTGMGEIRISTEQVRDRIVIIFEDDGPGIPEEITDKIFEPFFTTKAAGEGTGLGLSISWEIIVGKHNGTFSIQKKDRGARFVIGLPLEQPSAS